MGYDAGLDRLCGEDKADVGGTGVTEDSDADGVDPTEFEGIDEGVDEELVDVRGRVVVRGRTLTFEDDEAAGGADEPAVGFDEVRDVGTAVASGVEADGADVVGIGGLGEGDGATSTTTVPIMPAGHCGEAQW